MALAKPTQITVPFASSGLKNTIPETATGSNRASMQEGFPAITMTDVDQGGMAPYGQDMNGIIYDVTKAIQYQQAGGFFPYDATFAAAIDGYPIGAILTSQDGTQLFQNTLDGNTSDPENGGANWSQITTTAALANKQDKLNQTQMDAVNSGITSAKVAVYDSYASTKQNTLTFDNAPTNGSTNPVTSDGIYAALGTKQDTITVDATPASGSTNPVQSGGVYSALADKVDIAGGDSSATVATATGSTTSRTLANHLRNIYRDISDTGAWHRKRIVVDSVGFTGYDDALSSASQISGETATLLFPVGLAYNDGQFYVHFQVFKSGNVRISGVDVIGIWNEDGTFYQWHTLENNTAEGIVVKEESGSKYLYTIRSNKIDKYLINETNGSSYTLSTSITLTVSGTTYNAHNFLSFYNGRWYVSVKSSQISSYTLYYTIVFDELWNFITTVAFQKYQQFDNLVDYSDQDSFQDAIPHTQGWAVGDDGFYIAKGGSSTYASTYPLSNVAANGALVLGFDGRIRKSSLVSAAGMKQVLGDALGVSFTRTECEGIAVVGKKVYTLHFLSSTDNHYTILEEFSASDDAVDFSEYAFEPTSYIWQCDVKNMPKSMSTYTNPWTGETLSSNDDILVMMYRYGIDQLTWCPSFGNTEIFTTMGGITILTKNQASLITAKRKGYGRYFDVYVSGYTSRGSAFYQFQINESTLAVTGALQNVNCTSVRIGDTPLTLGNSSGNLQWDSNNVLTSILADPKTDNTYALGSASLRWSTVYAGTGTIDTSDERLKSNIRDINDDVLDAWGDVNLRAFQFKDAIEKKGQDARIHAGVIAQQVQSAFEARGLDAFRFGLLCYDEWEAKDAVYDEETGELIDEAVDAGNRYSIRYAEALVLEAAYQRRRADRIEARLKAIEERLGE